MRSHKNRAAEIPEDIKRLVGRVEISLRAMKVDIMTPTPTVNDIEQRIKPHLYEIEAQLQSIVAKAAELKGQ